MIRKLLEAFFRHKLLLLLPPLLIPALVAPIALAITPSLYDTSVGVWVAHPIYLKDASNGWATPVQTQSANLTELLRTRAFMGNVAQRTSLAPLVGTPSGDVLIADLINRSVTIGGGAGEHLLVIRVQATTAKLSYELCKAIVDAFQEKSAADQADQASIAVDFYQSQVQDSQAQLNVASQGLRRYVTARGADAAASGQVTDAPASLPATMLDPKLAALQSGVQAAQSNFNTAQAALTQAQHDALAAEQGQQYGFQVLDPAQIPTSPTPQIKRIIVYPIAALVVGLGLSAMLLVMMVASDRSVRSEADLAPGLRILGIVPILKLKGVPKRLRAVATRRAIGAVAGTALPAATATGR